MTTRDNPHRGKPETCSICKKSYYGFGNNAYPINNGRCCDDCNSMVVIPARIQAIHSRETKQ